MFDIRLPYLFTSKTLCLLYVSTPKAGRYYLESLEFRVSLEVESCEVV